MVHAQSVEKEGFVHKIEHFIDKKSGEIVESKNKNSKIRHIRADECALIHIKLKHKKDVLLIDSYQNLKELGRVTLRRDGKTVALGLVQSL